MILSGGDPLKDSEREYAGVGFIIAPETRCSVMSYLQHSSRMAVLKIKVEGGQATIVTAYAPPATKPYDERQEFYRALGDLVTKLSTHGPKVVAGDFNARLHARQSGEEDVLGPGVFGKSEQRQCQESNRGLFMELCTRLRMCAANTLESTAPDI